MRGDARESAVDDGGHPGHRYAGLGDVRAEDHFSPGARRQRAILLRRGQVAMKRREEEVAMPGQLRARRSGLVDLGRARQEDEDVSRTAGHRETADRGSHLLLEPALAGLLQMLDLHREASALASDHGGAQMPGERSGL